MKMASRFRRILLCVTYCVMVQTAASAQWNPGTKVSKPEADGTVYVTVDNPLQHAQEYRVCLKIGFNCYGTVVDMQNVTDIVRYKVTDLIANYTYDVEVQPLDKNGQVLDDWIKADQSVFVPPRATPTTTTTTPDVMKIVDKKDSTSVVKVGVSVMGMLLMLIIGALATLYLTRTGYWRKILLFRCCVLRSLLRWDPPKILQLYVTDSSQFNHFVLTHGMFLENVLDVTSVDCQRARGISDPENWMKALASTHHVLIYTSPILMSHIRIMHGDGSAEDLQDSLRQELQAKTHIQICVEIIQLLCDSAEQRKRLMDRLGVVFVFSGCLDSDCENGSLLQRYFKAVPHFTVVKQGSQGTCLTAPQSLVSHLSGGRRNTYRNLLNSDWERSAEAEQLRGAAAQLKGNNPPGVDIPLYDIDANDGISLLSGQTDPNCELQQSTANANITLNVDVQGEDVTKTTVDHNVVDVADDADCQDRPTVTVKLNLHSGQNGHGQNVYTQGQNVTSDRPSAYTQGHTTPFESHSTVVLGTPVSQHNELGRHTERDTLTHTEKYPLTHANRQADRDALQFESHSTVALGTRTSAGAHTVPIPQHHGFDRKTETGAVLVLTQGENSHHNTSTNTDARKACAPQDSGFSSSSTDARGRRSVLGSSSLPVHSSARHCHGTLDDEQSQHQTADSVRNPARWDRELRLHYRRNTAHSYHEQQAASAFTSMLPQPSSRFTQGSHTMHHDQRPLHGYSMKQESHTMRHELGPLHGYSITQRSHTMRHEQGPLHGYSMTQGSHTMRHEQGPLHGYNNLQHDSSPLHGHSNARHGSTPSILCHPQSVAYGDRMHQEHGNRKPQLGSKNMHDKTRPQSADDVPQRSHLPADDAPQRGHLPADDAPQRSHLPADDVPQRGHLPADDVPQRGHLPADDVPFEPPEYIGSHVNIPEQFRQLNENAEQHWNSHTG